MKVPVLLVADSKGNIFEKNDYEACGKSANTIKRLTANDFIELPHGSELFFLPNRKPIGFHIKNNTFEAINGYQAVAAFVAPAYTQTYLSAYEQNKEACLLPLYAYSCVGWKNDKYYTTALRIDSDKRQDPKQFNISLIEKKVKEFRKKYPKNRLVEHLAENCALNYHCRAAQNYFLGRWECPLPVSRTCNANCQGCLSFQPEENNINPAQYRLSITPTVDELVEIAVDHLNHAPNAVVSFGQGCEGEPLLEADLIKEAIIQIRKHTQKGIINLNTNASRPEAVENLCKAGLQSIRISMNSAIEKWYMQYFNPKNYSFDHVIESLRIANKYHIWVSVNYFVFPGITDSVPEKEAFYGLLKTFHIDMIQWRNFNIDPEWYLQRINLSEDISSIGVSQLIQDIQRDFPHLTYGYYNPSEEIIQKARNKTY